MAITIDAIVYGDKMMDYPEGVTSNDHIAHDMKRGRFPTRSTVEQFLAERSGEPARVTGVGRDAEHERSLIIYFSQRPSDDEMRAVHITLHGTTKSASGEGERLYREACVECRASLVAMGENPDVVEPEGVLQFIERWTPDTFPASPEGQVHFGRAMLEMAAHALRAALASPPHPIPENMLDKEGE